MNPAVKRLGSVRIERLETPKDVSVKQKAKKSNLELNDSLSEEENEDSEEVFTSEVETDEEGLEIPIPQSSLSGGSGHLKRTSDELKLGPDISFKKFKPDNEKNKPSLTTHNEKKIDDDTESSSEEDDSFYDSELESEDDDRQNNELGNGAGNNVKKFDNESQNKVQVKSDVNIDNEKLNKGENHEDRLEKTEENSSNDNIIKEPHDEEYDKDIKKKLKEMGEITFATVKKGEKPKTDSPPSTENEVVITKKSGEEVTVVSKGNLRRNIREVMDETKLDETTLAAQRQEAERLKRVQDQQRLLREYQKQAQQERTQQRVMSLLQGNIYAKPGPSNANKVGGTVLVKLPNGQTAPMTKVSRPEFDILKVPRPEPFNTVFHPQNTSMNQIRPTAPFQMASTRTIPAKPPHSGIQLPPSLSLSPISKKLPSKSFSNTDSDSENEEAIKEDTLKHKIIDQTIEVSSDDDCIVVSESECEQNDEDEPDDPCNSGMHTNDEFNLPDDQGRVLVNVGHPEDEPDVIIAPQIAKIIKPHQIGGVRFLYDNIVETVSRFDPGGGFGCILAHSMGLGKTLQIVTFSDLFLRYTPAKKILCIMPINTLQNWMAEFNIWTPTVEAAAQSALNAHGDVRPRNFNLHVLNDSHKTLVARQKVIRAWNSQGGVLMIGYEQFRLLSMRKTAKKKRNKTPLAAVNLADEDKNKPIFDEIYLALVNPGADLVICDEGHRIKNSHASISAALKQLRTKRRVVLTGYPLQNNLTEYWCMVDFVRPNYLGSKTEFLNMFERPIMNGQCIDSTESDIKLMRYRAHVLHSLLVGFVQRRSHTVLQTVLPKKEEYVLLVRLKPFQRKLYDRFMNDVVRTQNVPNPLKAFAVCCKIWNHPDVLYNFLVKRAQGEAVDLDLEEVGTVSGVSTAGETTKPTKRGSAKSRKTPAKGRNGKPAASVTPYNSTPESAGTSINKLNDGNPPQFNNVNIGGSRIPAVTNFHENGTNFHSATNNRIPASTSSQYNFNENDPINKDGKYGPYMNEFNQPRTSFEGISQFFGDYEKNAVSNTQYPQFANNSNQNNFTENQIESRLFNMDQKNTVSVSNNNSNNQNHQNFDQFGYHPQNYWESENKLEFNQSWIKKEDDSTEESKNKINIISDVKLNTAIPGTEDKKINIISDIKLEPKNEEEIKFDNFEQINIKKADEDEDVKVVENSLTKLVSLSALKDSKEDSGIPYEWAIELLKDYLPGQIENAAKFQILFCIIKESLALGDRLLVFSQSLITLDLIEQFLQMSEIPGQTYKWLKNSSYYRLDGSTGAQEREKLINEFNSNPKIFLFLVSTRAGSLGINLIGANRVIVLDASWNPCHDTQAVCRVYRYGQRKPCFVYRLVVDNCLEKKIYDRQVSKQGMSDRVVDECNPDAHLTIKDVTSLCYDDDKNDDEEERIKDWSSLKYSYIDVVLQKVLDKYGATLSKKPFHHESLLIDRKEKKLSQQEKRLAKKGYERDKNAARQPAHHSNGYGRGQRPVASVRPMPQLADRPTRWIPAEHWQRQGMTAQEMTLPLDVVIPTNQRKKGNIVLKAGQKVLVLKSPKGVYMQLESGKIVAIKTAIKVKGRADDNINDPPLTTTNNIPIAGRPSSQIQRPPQVQNNVAKDFMPGYVKFNVKSARRPSLPNNHFASKMQNRRTNIPTAGNHHQFVNSHNDSEIIPGSSSEEEAESDKNSGVAELEKKISHLNKSISMRHRNTIPQTVNFKESPIMERNISKQTNNMVFNNSSSYQETLDNLTSTTTTTTNLFPQNNVENVDSDDEDFDEYRSIEKDVVEKQNEEISPELTLGGINQLNNEADSIFQTSMINKANYQTMQPKIEPSSSSSTEPNNQPNNYGYNYDYNIPTYQTQSLPLAQGFTYAPQPSQPSQFDNYGNYQPAGGEYHHHYGYENFPNSQQQQQPHYVAQPPNFSDYNNAVVPTTVVNYQEQNYSPYPPPPGPQNIYQQPSNSYPDYVQFPPQNPSSVPQIPQQQSSNNYYQGS